MSASLKKIKKILPAFSPEQVKTTVLQALKSDDKARDALFSSLKGKGLDKEICASFLAAVQEQDSEVVFETRDLIFLREYFSLLGSESSIHLVEELVKILAECQKNGRNAAMLLEYLLNTVNIIGYGKLRSSIKEKLPEVVQLLWKADEYALSAYVAKQLLYVLLLEKSYLEVADVEKVWKDMLIKPMKKCPLFALLTVLLSGSSDTHWTTVILSSIDADSFGESTETDELLSRTAQFTAVFLQHKEYLLRELNFVTVRIVIARIFVDAEKNATLATVLSSFADCRDLHSTQDSAVRLLVSAAFAVVLEELHNAGTLQNKSDITAWFTSMIGLLEDGEDKSQPLLKSLKKFIQHFVSNDGKMKKPKSSDVITNIFISLRGLHLPKLSEATAAVLKGAFLLAGAVFDDQPEVVATCLLHLSTLIGQYDHLPITENVTAWLKIFYFSWLPAVIPSLTEEVADAVVTVFGCGLAQLPTGMDSELQYVGSRGTFADFSAERVLRLAAFSQAAPWRRYDSTSASHRQLFFFEVKSNALDRVLSAVDTSDSEQSQLLQGYVFSLFNTMAKDERINVLPLFVDEKQRKKLAKSALKILKGKVNISSQSTVSKALHFFVNNSHGCAPEDSCHISHLFNWKCLLTLFSNGSEPINYLMDRLTSENALGLLSSFSEEIDGKSESEVVSLISIAELLTKRVAATATELLLDVLINLSASSSLPPSILSLCADFVKVSAKTPFESKIVALSLTIASTFNETLFEAPAMFSMESLLFSCLRFTHPSVTNDQCAPYTHLVAKHFRGVQFFAQFKKAPQDEVDLMVYGCARIAHQICQHAAFFSRIICSVISETVLGYQHIELAMCKLHSINDKHSSALLATTLPPAEKRQYSRIFPEIKKSLKHIV